jgi:hypothetical protein
LLVNGILSMTLYLDGKLISNHVAIHFCVRIEVPFQPIINIEDTRGYKTNSSKESETH